VRKRFGPKVIFAGLNLGMQRGETLTVMGASGSGKSVLLKMLIGLIQPDAGEIFFGGRDIAKMNDEELTDLRRRIAYLFQGAALFDSLTVGENVAYGLREQFWDKMTNDEIEARVAQALGLVGLPGIQVMRPSDLSGGMKKRVGLARTLALQPEVILYDEPTTGLDPINTARINHLIRGIQRTLKLTSVVVTHDMGTAFSVSDRLAMIAGNVGTINFEDLTTIPDAVPAFAIYTDGQNDVWVSVSGTLTSNVSATSQSCAVPLPPYARSGSCKSIAG